MSRDLPALCGREQLLTWAQDVGLCRACLSGEAELVPVGLCLLLLLLLYIPTPGIQDCQGSPGLLRLLPPPMLSSPLSLGTGRGLAWGNWGRAEFLGQEPTRRTASCKSDRVNVGFPT